MNGTNGGEVNEVSTYCNNCVAGPDLMTIEVKDGVAYRVKPNVTAVGVHPAEGKVCVKAYGLIDKTYNPARILTPMKRTNPRKGRNEDPGFVPISWEEALDTVEARLKAVQAKGMVDEAGLPRVAVTFGHGGTPEKYMGTFPAFLAAWGAIDFSFGTGQGVKCTHSEHLYGEFWHRAFTVAPDTPLTRFVISCGANTDASGGVTGVRRHADARVRGMRRVQVEPSLSVTAACSARWVPIKPKTDAAFLLALINVMLHEHPRSALDLEFLRDRTASPYLVGPHGYYLRAVESGKPLLWDAKSGRAVPFDQAGAEPALEGRFAVGAAVELGADQERWEYDEVEGETSFTRLVEHVRGYTPEWAAGVCDVPAAMMRAVAGEYLANACIGETIEIDGHKLPFRPVAVTLGKTVNNGWGGYECCWARTVLAMLVGALEVPGGTLGTTSHLNRPLEDRIASVKPGEDGFMVASLNPTGKGDWVARPTGRNAHRTLVPLVGNTAWSQALGPSHLAWMFVREAPAGWTRPSYPDMWFVFRANPVISFWEPDRLVDVISKVPFTVAFAHTLNETNVLADILLPEATDLESLQLIRLGGTKYIEQYWDYRGAVLRQPAVKPRGEARDFTWIAGDLVRRLGLTEKYVQALNRGSGIPFALKGENYDFSLKADRSYSVEEIWDAACKAASARISGGKEIHDLAWFQKNSHFVVPFRREDWYLYPAMVRNGLRFELPYQERLLRIGRQLGNRLHERELYWWDEQLTEYQALPGWDDTPSRWLHALEHSGADPADYPFWLITTKSMPYGAGNNSEIPLMNEVSRNMRHHGRVVINSATARNLGIEDDDLVEVRSRTGVTRGQARVSEGVRPDTLVITGQWDHWATPYAKDLNFPSLNTLAEMSLDLTDANGSGADLVRVAIRRLGGAS